MIDIKLTLRQLTGQRVAFSAWLLKDRTTRVVRMSEREKLEADAGDTAGYLPFAPGPDARFLMAAVVPALNTADGWPVPGDCWEDEDGRLQIAVSREPGWNYGIQVASDPMPFGPANIWQSRINGLQSESIGDRLTLEHYDHSAIAAGSIWLRGLPAPRRLTRIIDRLVPNHHSVSFDAANSGSVNGGGNSITVALTIASNSDLYIAGCSSSRVGQSLSTVTWNGTGLTSRMNITSPSTARSEYYDLVNPATGAHNIVFTYTANTDAVAGGISCYGVNQTTPRSNTASANHDETGTGPGQGTNPLISGMSSATGELVLSNLCWDTSASLGTPTDTLDASWTSLWNVDSGSGGSHSNSRGGCAGYIAGAATVTRSDTLSAGSQWAMLAVSLAAVSVAGQPAARRLGQLRPTELGHEGVTAF